ncbi:MAG: glycosyltransferase family 87 protein [Geodermatophilaceae bacterium]
MAEPPAAPGGAVEDRPNRVFPTWDDPVARTASTMVGGPIGRHAYTGRNWFWTPLRVLLAMTLATLALAWVKQSPCLDGNWTGSKQYTHFCYSDTIPLWGIHGLSEGLVPYASAPVEYPVLTGGFMYVANELAGSYNGWSAGSGLLPDLPGVQTYYVVTALLLSLCMLVVTWTTALLSRRRIWDAAMVALSPLLFVHAYTNWDLFVVALAGAGLLAWSRRHPVLAGVLLGLGAAAKFYPLLFLGPLFLLCLRAGRLRDWAVTAGGTLAALAAVNVPVALLYTENWSLFFTLNTTRAADPDSVWNIAIQLGAEFLNPPPAAVPDMPNGPGLLNALTLVCFLVVCVGIAVLALRAELRPRLMQLLFLVVAGFLLTNKVWSPQYSLWLLPLAVLALPRWKPILIWQLTEAVLWVPRLLWYLGQDNNGVKVEWFLFAVIIRDVAVIALMCLVVRDVLRPEHDVVRRGRDLGVDDPAGGVLDGAPDVHVLRSEAGPEERDVVGDAVGGGLADDRSAGLSDHREQ